MTTPSDTNRRLASIALSSPGSCPQRIDQGFLIPLERRLATVEGVTTIATVARKGFGTLEVGVDPTADVAAMLADVEEAVRCVEAGLPADARVLVERLDDDCETDPR